LDYRRIGVTTLPFLGSHVVIGHVTIRFPMGHFLSVVLWNGVSICCRFRDLDLDK